jgi:hypothetical protein
MDMEAKDSIEATEAEVKGGQVVETKKSSNEKTEDEKVKVKRGRMDSVSIYEVSEGELTTLENGSRNSIFLNFSIFLLSIAVSFFTALVTADYTDKNVVFTIFVVLTAVGVLGGAFLLILWLRMSDEFKITIDKIKKRIVE